MKPTSEGYTDQAYLHQALMYKNAQAQAQIDALRRRMEADEYHAKVDAATKEEDESEDIKELLGRNIRIYKSKNKAIQDQISELKAKALIANRKLVPVVEKEYHCDTCGGHNGRDYAHPNHRASCFICDTENWDAV